MIIEEAILNSIKSALEDILTTNEYASGKSYLTNIGSNVYLWGKAGDPKPGKPIVELMDEDGFHNEDESDSGSDAEAMKIVIKIAAEEDTNTAALLRNAKADIKRCIGSFRNAFKVAYGSYFELLFSDWEIEIEKDSNKTGGVMEIEMLCQYQTSKWMLEETAAYYLLKYQSDFSSGVDGFMSDDTLTGNNDNISDGVVSENDVLKVEVETHDPISHLAQQIEKDYKPKKYRLKLKYYIPAANTVITKIAALPTSIIGADLPPNPVGEIKGAWTSHSIIFTVESITGIGIYGYDANNYQSVDAFGDVFYVKDITLEEVID